MYKDYVRCEVATGKFLYFPKQHANKVAKKKALVDRAMALRDQGLNYEASVIAGKIVRLNRQIPACGISEEQYARAMQINA